MKHSILVTRPISLNVLARLQQCFNVEINHEDHSFAEVELIEKLRGKDGIIASVGEHLTARVIAAAPRLKVIANMAVGYNNIDLDAATAAGVMATNTPDVLNETTADFAWGLMLATARRMSEAERSLRAGDWKHGKFDTFLGVDVHGATLGIFGMGRIGQAIARRSVGFGMQVIYHNRSRLSPQQEAEANHARHVDKDTLLRNADHLILTLPYTPDTHHVIGAAELSLMKSTATLVNLARGGIVDDAALIAALRERRIAAAGLDVFEHEPEFDRGFLTLPNVVLTPHIASASSATRRAMASRAADNLITALSGERPPDLLNPQVLEHRRSD